jgi:hypothetical protein
MTSKQPEELASLYARGLLEGEELAAFERALAGDPSLRAGFSEIKSASAQPASARGRASVAVFRWLPWVLATGFAVFSGWTWTAISKARRDLHEASQRSIALTHEHTRRTTELLNHNSRLVNQMADLASQRTRLEIRLSKLEAEKRQLDHRIVALEALDPLADIRAVVFAPRPGAPKGAEVTALWDARRQAGTLDLSKFLPPAEDKDYQLWILSSDSPVPINAGVISTHSSQPAFRAPAPQTQVTALAISLEPKGGSESPRGPFLFVGKIGKF